jgi:hypothetical protein
MMTVQVDILLIANVEDVLDLQFVARIINV